MGMTSLCGGLVGVNLLNFDIAATTTRQESSRLVQDAVAPFTAPLRQ